MAMHLPGRRGGAIADINVTPLADVMIVLLIIFMVVTPVVTGPQGVRLPSAANARKADPDLTVRLTREGALFLADQPVANLVALKLDLAQRLAQVTRRDRTVYVQADRESEYLAVMEIVDACREAGTDEVALMTGGKVGS